MKMTATGVPETPVSRPGNWREILSDLGYVVKGDRCTCPLCGRPGLCGSILQKGVFCHRDRTHFRAWPELIAASKIPAKPGSPASRLRRNPVPDAAHVRRMFSREAAAYEWTFAKDAPADHPYLLAKRIPPMGARIDGKGNLLIPAHRLGQMGIGVLSSLERIGPAGEKRFEGGCQIKGTYCFVRPDWDSIPRPFRLGPILEPHPPCVWVCEGFATAATVALATGEVACCVFSAGNLTPALEVLTRRMRETEFIIAADNDRKTPGNPGLTAAFEAARRFGLKVALPQFPPGTEGSDWNDFAVMLDGGEETAP